MVNCVLCGSQTDSSRTVFPVCPECSAESNQDPPNVLNIELREPRSQNYLNETREQNFLTDSPEQKSQSLKGLGRDLDHLPSFLKSLRGSRTKFDFAISLLLWFIDRSGGGSARNSSSTMDTRTNEVADEKTHKDNGAGAVIGGILIIIGGVWSIAQGDSEPGAGIMIIIGIPIIAFGIAMSLFGILRFLMTQSKK